MVTLRLQRIGRKKQPYFRLIAQDKTKDPWDKSLEILGTKNPRTKETTLNEERIKYWLSVGAQPTNTVHNMLVVAGILKDEKKKKAVTISKKRAAKMKGKEESKEEKKEVVEEEKNEKADEAKEEAPKEEKAEEKKEEVKVEETKE